MALRACMLLLAFAALALAVIHLRSQQVQSAAKGVALEKERIALRRELWKQQTMVARLRTPARLYGSLEWFQTNLARRDVQSVSTSAAPKPSEGVRD